MVLKIRATSMRSDSSRKEVNSTITDWEEDDEEEGYRDSVTASSGRIDAHRLYADEV